MGSLYDIGNMRYKHFTFYTRGDGSEYTPLDQEFPGVETYPPELETDEQKQEYFNTQKTKHDTAFDLLIDELTKFLDSVWPLDAVWCQIGTAHGRMARVILLILLSLYIQTQNQAKQT